MKPKKPDNHPDLFRSQLSQILNLSHPLCRLADQINWPRLEEKIEVVYGDGCGHPALPTRLLAGLHYLKYTFNESDESVVERWVENPYWQYFCGYEQLQHKLPLHPTTLVKWRNRVGDMLESLLEEILNVAIETKALKRHALKHVNVDTTVHEKAIAFPTDARLYHKMRITLVREAHKRQINLRQSFKKVGKKAFIMQGRYASAKQMKRAGKQTRKLKTYLGRLTRDIKRKTPLMDEHLTQLIERSTALLKQKRHDKNKIYSVHEPAVHCIAKGKIHKRYEFGSKVSIVSTSKDNWVVSAQSLDNPYDGHTLESALNHVTQLTGITPEHAYCDMGYRGHGIKEKTKVHLVGKIPKRATKALRKWMKRRAAVEPIIGHLKSDYRLNRNHLKGKEGDRANTVLAAAAYNMAKLLAWFYWPKYFSTLFSDFKFVMRSSTENSGCLMR